jgi:hypothetical protein
MIHRFQHGKFANGCAVTRQLVGADGVWDLMLAQQPFEEALGGVGVPVSLQEYIQYSSVFIDCSPQPVGNATHEYVHFIQVPSQASTRFTVTQSSSEFVTEVDAPRADGFSRHLNATLEEEFFDIAVTQGVSVVQPDGAPDDREWKSVEAGSKD